MSSKAKRELVEMSLGISNQLLTATPRYYPHALEFERLRYFFSLLFASLSLSDKVDKGKKRLVELGSSDFFFQAYSSSRIPWKNDVASIIIRATVSSLWAYAKREAAIGWWRLLPLVVLIQAQWHSWCTMSVTTNSNVIINKTFGHYCTGRDKI